MIATSKPNGWLAAAAVLNLAGKKSSSRADLTLSAAIEQASQHCEQVLRAGGALHILQGGSKGDVQLKSFEAAHEPGTWLIDSYLNLKSVRSEPARVEEDAEQLDRALTEMARMNGPHFQLDVLRRLAPNFGLTSARFNKALPVLGLSGRINVYIHGRDEFVYVNAPAPRRVGHAASC